MSDNIEIFNLATYEQPEAIETSRNEWVEYGKENDHYEWIIGRYKTIADLADRDSDKLRSLESLTKIAGLFDMNEKKTEQLTVFAGFTDKQMEAIKGGKTKVIAEAKRELQEAPNRGQG